MPWEMQPTNSGVFPLLMRLQITKTTTYAKTNHLFRS